MAPGTVLNDIGLRALFHVFPSVVGGGCNFGPAGMTARRANTKTGPDLSIQVPLSNLKANKDSVLVNKGIFSKTGVSARLRAQKGDDGKIKISWDPFNKAGKQMKKKSA